MTTSMMEAYTPSPPFCTNRASRVSQGRKKTKKAKSADAHGLSVSAVTDIGAHAEEPVVAKHSKHHSSRSKPNFAAYLQPMRHLSPESPLPESKAAANGRSSSGGRRHAHVPSAPVQSPETACESLVAYNTAVVAAEQPPTTPNKIMPDHAGAQLREASSLELLHSGLGTINVPAYESQQPSSPLYVSSDSWLAPVTGSFLPNSESYPSVPVAGCASVPPEISGVPLPYYDVQQPQKATQGLSDVDSALTPRSAPGTSTMEANGFKRGLIGAIFIGFVILLLLLVLPLGPPRPKMSSATPEVSVASSPLPTSSL
ncbi:hypothetical protein MRX96_001715 [Rhipicephalus microplus]